MAQTDRMMQSGAKIVIQRAFVIGCSCFQCTAESLLLNTPTFPLYVVGGRTRVYGNAAVLARRVRVVPSIRGACAGARRGRARCKARPCSPCRRSQLQQQQPRCLPRPVGERQRLCSCACRVPRRRALLRRRRARPSRGGARAGRAEPRSGASARAGGHARGGTRRGRCVGAIEGSKLFLEGRKLG